MDTRIISLLTILALNFNTSFANTNVIFTEIRPVERSMMYLAPVSPVEAAFSDLVPEADASNAILLPVTPKEATFDDETVIEFINEEPLPISLSPSAPTEAGFEDPI